MLCWSWFEIIHTYHQHTLLKISLMVEREVQLMDNISGGCTPSWFPGKRKCMWLLTRWKKSLDRKRSIILIIIGTSYVLNLKHSLIKIQRKSSLGFLIHGKNKSWNWKFTFMQENVKNGFDNQLVKLELQAKAWIALYKKKLTCEKYKTKYQTGTISLGNWIPTDNNPVIL